MRVAVTGAGGRLGSEIVRQLTAGPGAARWDVVGLARDAFDLDDPLPGIAAVAESEPDVVVHAAAWTDVDACALDPERAQQRNGDATARLAEACSRLGCGLVVVSTNEVFDGNRRDQLGYSPDDPAKPGNAYGRSKLAGETAARAAFGARPEALGIVRTAWLFGSNKPDFPERIEAAARRAIDAGSSLRLVGDELGTPTYVPDLAAAIVRLLEHGHGGTHHVVNGGVVSRAGWAREVLDRRGLVVPIEEIRLDEFDRPSRPPRWGVLAPTPLPGGPLRGWREAMDERMRDHVGGLR